MGLDNNIPEDWKEENLESVIDLIIDHRGKTPKKLGGDWCSEGYRAVSAKTIKNGKLVNEDKMNILPNDLYDKWMKNEIEFGDVLLTSEAPLGEHMIWKSIEKIVLSQRIFGIRTNSKILNSSYFNYFIDSRFFQHELKSRESGSTVTGIKQSELLKTKVVFPSLPEQKAIAKVLTAFDDKIELLQAQNKTLETMAQTIFKEWFGKYQKGDDLPEGWEFCELNDVVSKSNTGADAIQKAPIVSENTGVRCIRIGDLSKNRSYNYWGFTKVTDKNFKQFQLKKFDIVVTRTSILGLNKLIMEDLNAVYNNGLIKISLVENISPYFIYGYFKSKVYRDYINMINNDTSTRPNMKIDYLLRFPIIIPSKDMEIKYSKIMESVMLKISKNTTQIQSLTKTRDTLLPKLMSGQVRVNNIKQTIDA